MASFLDSLRCIRNAPYRLHFRILAVSTFLPISGGLTVVDAEVNKDGGGFNDLAATEVETGTTGYGYVDMSATETAATTVIVQVKASNAGAMSYIKELEFEPCLDSGVCTAGTAGTATLPATASNTADLYNGAIFEIVRGTGAGQTRTITDHSTGRVITLDRDFLVNPSTDSVYIIHPAGGVKVGTDIVPETNATRIGSSQAAADNMARLYKYLFYGTVAASPSPSTTSFGSTTIGTFADDYFNNMLVVFEDGPAAGLAEKVSDFTGTGGVFTLADAIGTAPAAGNNFVVLGRIK